MVHDMVWLCGCVVVWLCGCVVVWLCGCVVYGVVRVRGMWSGFDCAWWVERVNPYLRRCSPKQQWSCSLNQKAGTIRMASPIEEDICSMAPQAVVTTPLTNPNPCSNTPLHTHTHTKYITQRQNVLYIGPGGIS